MFGNAVGTIERRILVNYAADPDIAKTLIPTDLKLHIVNGKAIVGVCLIRLTNMRPSWAPPFVGLTSENIAHRIAIEYDTDTGEKATGVYVPMRHTNSLVTSKIGSRIYPGVYKMAKFATKETGKEHKISVVSKQDPTKIEIEATETTDFKSDLFSTFEEASNFFKCSSVGFSPDRNGCELEGIKLATSKWEMHPMEVQSMSSNLYDDPNIFPEGTIKFDGALLMKNIGVTWE